MKRLASLRRSRRARNAAQFPLRFRENILLWLVQSFFSRPTSLVNRHTPDAGSLRECRTGSGSSGFDQIFSAA